MGDPRLKGMNDTQWVFELEAMNLQDVERLDDLRVLSKIVRHQVVTMLGLNILPVEDEETHLLREPEDSECLPLVAFIGREDILTAIKQKRDEYENQQVVQAQLRASDPLRGPGKKVDTGVVEMSPEELEQFMNDEGDIEFENAPEDLLKAMRWGDKGSQMLLENLVLSKEDLGDDPFASKARTIGKAREDLLKPYKKRGAASAVQIEEIDLGLRADRPADEQRPIVTLDVK